MTAGTLVAQSAIPGRSLLNRSAFEFLITGGLTLVLLPLAYFYRKSAGLESSEYIVSFSAFYAAYLINDPHFSASYLLFYKNARARFLGPEFRGAQRVRYIVAGLIVPLALIAWIVASMLMQSAQTLGTMVQLMYLLVGWHYVKQGFGVLSVLSARRGVRFSQHERWVFLAHCFCGWAYAWTSPRELGRDYEETGVVYSALAHPRGLEEVALVLFCLSTIALIVAIVLRLMRRQGLPPLAASCGYFMSIWLWTIYSNVDPLMIYVIPALHSLQYWYFVYLLKRGEAKDRFEQRVEGRVDGTVGPEAALGRFTWRRLGLFFMSTVALAWLFFHGLPDVLDGTLVASAVSMGLEPDVSARGLGTTPYLAAFATFINIHHYFIDHVIWRRENPDLRYLRD